MEKESPDQCPGAQHCVLADESADKAADKAVAKVFAMLGVDVTKPESIEEFRIDLRFGRSMRRAADRGVLVAVSVVVTALLAALFLGFGIQIRGK